MALDPRIIPTPGRIIDPRNHLPPGGYGVTTAVQPVRLPNRRTLDALDWWIDCSLLLAQASTDYVTQVRTSVTPAGAIGDLVAADVAVVDQYAGALLVGGRLDVSYVVRFTITTSTGRVLTLDLQQRVTGDGITPGQSGSTSWDITAPTETRIKRGETLVFQITAVDDDDVPIDISPAVLTAQARTALGDLIADLGIMVTDEPSVAMVESPTDLWPLGQVFVDFRAEIGDQVAYSETITIHIDRPVTT